jgi:peptidoglycan/xylan/chitin deacetylase (PgdA/CDA1 family)
MTEKDLTVVMYHYVRDLKFTRYPAIKGLDYNLFVEQILYLEKYYNFVTIEQVIAAYGGGKELPSKAVLLTFDDGYTDHFTKVFPFLYSKGIQGAFYAPVKAITKHTLLDVNKIHFILAAAHINAVLSETKKYVEKYQKEYQLLSYKYYWDKLAIESRYDSKEVIFLKRLLQVELEEIIRNKITDELFKILVGVDEAIFSRELYMSKEQLACMVACGMHVGSHGYDHYWLGSLTKEAQRNEITSSIKFIEEIGGNTNKWTICYPYGNYNKDTISLLNEYKCSLGFTTIVDLATIENKNDAKFKIARLDTNDLPKDRHSLVNKWFNKAK